MNYQAFKRLFDIVFSICALAVLWPLLLIIGLLVIFESPGGALYRGVRTGQYGKDFRIRKFRTMVQNAENLGGPSTALNDPRFTRVGRVLRKTKLDELPQLLDILEGTMSFVGPRPQVKHYTDMYKDEELSILDAKPGLTDYASIHFIDMDATLGDADVDDYYLKQIEPTKNLLRIRYVKDQSFVTDLKIIMMTFLGVIGFKKWNIDP